MLCDIIPRVHCSTVSFSVAIAPLHLSVAILFDFTIELQSPPLRPGKCSLKEFQQQLALVDRKAYTTTSTFVILNVILVRK